MDSTRTRMMDKEEYRNRYGRFRVLRKIRQRMPVTPGKAAHDPNRSLMIKFKYNDMTPDEELAFHENVKNLIYKVMHTNCVMMEWEDIYQEIWKKISRCKYSWNETKGTYVSTWITIVANSVINTLRVRVSRYQSRYCLYDDLAVADPDGDGGSIENGDAVEEFFNGGEQLVDSRMLQQDSQELLGEFVSTLDENERRVMSALSDRQDDIVDAFDRRGSHGPVNAIRQKLGYDENSFAAMVSDIYEKYLRVYNKPDIRGRSSRRQDGQPADGDDRPEESPMDKLMGIFEETYLF